MQIIIFYSWQSDIEYNHRAIRDALRLAIIDLEQVDINPQIKLIDSTSNQVGATRIPDVILSDIAGSDIFVVDLTIVGKSEISGRKISNPNVLVELGYAISQVGWERTIVLFNQTQGELTDIPFDIEKRSILTFRVSGKDDNNGKGQLRVKLKEWIQRIINENPSKPQTKPESPDRERANDVKQLREVISIFPIEELDELFENGDRIISMQTMQRTIRLDTVLSSKKYYMNDKKLRTLIANFQKKWEPLVDSLDKEYHQKNGKLISNDTTGKSKSMKYLLIREYLKDLEKAYQSLLKYVRDSYPEIDI